MNRSVVNAELGAAGQGPTGVRGAPGAREASLVVARQVSCARPAMIRARGVVGAVGLMLLAVSCTGAAAASDTHTVVIADMKFSPESLTVKRGDTIVWVNKDFFPHNARAQGRSFESPDLGTNKSWRHVATKAGTFSYVCTLHPTMKATVTVK
jgi:plastocyanin